MLTLKKASVFLSLMLVLCVLFATVQPVHAASSSQIQEEIDALEQEKVELEERLQELENQLSDNLQEMEAIFAQKQVIDRQVFLIRESMAATDAQILAYTLAIADRQEELEAAQHNLDELSKKYRERIRIMEEEGKLSYWAVLLQANSFFDFLDRLERSLPQISAVCRKWKLPPMLWLQRRPPSQKRRLPWKVYASRSRMQLSFWKRRQISPMPFCSS